MDPLIVFLLVLIIGIVVGLLFHGVYRRGWLSERLTGRSGGLTSALVGIAGAFIGFHISVILGLLPSPLMHYLAAALGAVLVLWLWRGR